MAFLEEQAVWEEGIRQFEKDDVVEGGPDGVDNIPLKQLADRTVWLKEECEAIRGLGGDGVLSGCVMPFTGAFGGPGNKHPINRKTGEVDLNYALCDGGTYTAPDGISVTTPDLTSTFIMGGTGKNTGTKGGAATATSSNAGSHTHTVAATGSAGDHAHTNPNTNSGGDHAHTGGTTGATTLTADLMPWHTHPQVAYRGYGSSNTSGFTTLSPVGSSFGNNRLYENTEGAGGSGAHAHTGGATSTNGAHVHGIGPTSTTGAHTHTSGAVSSAVDHSHTVSTLPPYYTLAYIMVL